MKKIISILLALVILFSFAACSAGKEPETTKPAASDSSDASVGNEDSKKDTSKQDSKDNTEKSSTKKAESTEKGTTKAAEKTTAKKDEKTTKKPSTTKEETTVKREIKLNVIYPYYNSTKTKVNIEYKGPKDKKYTSIFEKKEKGKKIVDKPDITLDGRKTLSYEIDKKIAGDVDIRVTLDDVELLENNFKISGKDSEITIELVSGTEILVDDF